jgi:DNA polymerase alpha subunit A
VLGLWSRKRFPWRVPSPLDQVTGARTVVSGLHCTYPDCSRPKSWGSTNHFECYSRISNAISLWVRRLQTKYYQGLVRCDEPSCGLETRQLSVMGGGRCLRRGCNGHLLAVESERDVHTHLVYLESLFNENHTSEKLELKSGMGRKADLLRGLNKHDRTTFEQLHQQAKQNLKSNAFNWISPSFWKGLFMLG